MLLKISNPQLITNLRFVDPERLAKLNTELKLPLTLTPIIVTSSIFSKSIQ
jgi:hypothetical protein